MSRDARHVDQPMGPERGLRIGSPIQDRPMRGTLFTLERLLVFAKELAGTQDVVREDGPRLTPLLPLLDQAETQLADFQTFMTAAVRSGHSVPAATEWLLDNTHLVEEQFLRVREDLPKGYGAQLPHLGSGSFKGFPRVYEAMVALVEHTDARIDREYLTRYVSAFQEVAPLTIGELWAVPIMLRVAFVENLRRLSALVRDAYEDDRLADRIADDLIRASDTDQAAIPGLLRELDREWDASGPAFLLRLNQRLRGQADSDPSIASWLDARVAALGVSLQTYRTQEHHRQAANQVSVANTVTSIRFLGALNWRAFFENVSIVEHILRQDPDGVYERMTFLSRDRYRNAIEDLAKRCPYEELEVAQAALDAAKAAAASTVDDPAPAHVGWYLISEGRYDFEKSLRYRPHRRERLYRGPLRRGGILFFSLFAALTALASASVGVFAVWSGTQIWWAVLLTLLASVPLSDVALAIANRTVASIWRPRLLPSLDVRLPVSEQNRTLVVTTVLAKDAVTATDAACRQEVHYLTSSADPDVHFALLLERADADEETDPSQDPVVLAAMEQIEQLNRVHGGGESVGPFHLIVRSRIWDEQESVWMGWERKRGALWEVNRLLRGADDTTIALTSGDSEFLSGVKFVLALDADTSLPRDGVRRLVSVISHPLNRARLDESGRRVVRGYGLVQPRVSVALPSAGRTLFAWMHTGVIGIDPYGGIVSDVYQDVFGEGSFNGKGIWDVDVFLSVLEGRIPQHSLLSHDLLEGNYLRVGLASDVEVFDEHPSMYSPHTIRQHRWVRGDWQTLPWLFPRVPLTDGGREPNPLSGLHRWKLLDNLRRSLVPLMLLALVCGGWLLFPARGPAWSLMLLGIVFFPAIMQFVDASINRPADATLRSAVVAILQELNRDSARALFALVTLPHQAWISGDAITRTLWRSFVSHKKMLEWVTAAEAEKLASPGLAPRVRAMGPSILVSVVLLGPGLLLEPAVWLLELPLIFMWLASPAIVQATGRPMTPVATKPSASEITEMRRIARKTWRFFDTFATEEDRWLIPDNYQEEPLGTVAHRTSPTNIGLQLLSYLCAHDLGYIGTADLVDRTGATLGSMTGMQRFRGHFYNWYDTRTLEPLPPGYISTVDSGNLAGHLLVLRQGLIEAVGAPLVGTQVLAGLGDLVRLAVEEAGGKNVRTGSAFDLAANDALEALRVADPSCNAYRLQAVLRSAEQASERMRGAALTDDLDRALPAVDQLSLEVRRHLDDIDMFMPWAPLLGRIPTALADDPGLAPLLFGIPSLQALVEGLDGVRDTLMDSAGADPDTWAGEVLDSIDSAAVEVVSLLGRLRLMSDIAREVWEHTDFSMLYDSSRKLFSIGFNTSEGRLDQSFYDLLASECRLASFLAVAKGDVPAAHWFRLGRRVTTTSEGHALLSWSASMFEYLMPLLVMKSWPDTLLDETYKTVVRRQIQYGRQAGVPWGISESAFNSKDADQQYQYRAFGVPGLGLKRGLSDDVVIAPYATMLALPVDRRAALRNLEGLRSRGAEGEYGFFEAVDYTPGRIPAGEERALVKAYMAHHQGMGLVALTNEILDEPVRRRFHEEPLVRSADLLLQERTPRHVSVEHPHVEEVRFVRSVRELPEPVDRSYPTPHTPVPATHFLSNGSYSVMVTNAGSGYSRWRGLDVNRYREDVTRDCWGSFVYVRDTESGAVWSTTYQPTAKEPEEYNVTFSAHMAEFRRRDEDIETHTEIIVSPEDDVEVRRVTITNHGQEWRRLEFTSYFEIALADNAADQAHRTFSNLFVETEVAGSGGALLFSRRPRSEAEKRVWGIHVVSCDPSPLDPPTHETDRCRFIGRMKHVREPAAVIKGGQLSGSVGAVLDPVCSIRQTVTVAPGETVRLVFATGVMAERVAALDTIEKYRDPRSAQRALDLSWTSAQIVLRDLGIGPHEAVTYQRLASRLLLTDPYSPLKTRTPVENGLPLSALWSIGISGDHPILLLRIERIEDTSLVRQALLAHQYWRYKGLVSDLVILNTRPTAYSDELHDRLGTLVRTGHALELLDKPGGVFLRRSDQMNPDVRDLLYSVARATIDADRGSMGLQLNLRAQRPDLPLRLVPSRAPDPEERVAFDRPGLELDNGYGGFDPETGEYVIVLDGESPPAPWVNVMANESGFGTMVTEAGVGCTWAINSHDNRLTTWNNDPVSDGSGETMYVRDDETGQIWSPTLLPVQDSSTCVARHGFGYTRFSSTKSGIGHDLTVFVHRDEPVRIARLMLTNRTTRRRVLSVTHAVEWSLGESRSKAQQRVVTWYDSENDMLTAHNHFNLDHPGRATFLAANRSVASYTGSRHEFIGRNGHPGDPEGLRASTLGKQTGRFHDAAGVLEVKVELGPGETSDVTFLLGQTDTLAQARDLVSGLRQKDAVDAALRSVREYWSGILDVIQVETPDPKLDRLLSGWLLYQTLSCRILGRTALYQSSGAFGFRDQLQDSLALLHVRPDLVRARIVEGARKQFPEGDVLHWWMPDSGRGVRTRISDDRHWLPYVVAQYVQATGDESVLDESVPFLEGPPLPDGQADLYMAFGPSEQTATVYEHCLAALQTATAVGSHGLPLIGGGDWNDGMDRLGIGGSGESVWLAWFLDVTLRGFAQVCEERDDTPKAEELRALAASFVEAVEDHAWDGAWYRRAYADDGTPIGTSAAKECRIDAIAQAWASISGSGDPDRAATALAQAEEHLVDPEYRLIRLLSPPFDREEPDPGYIRGYVPGVRENGGQYTHGVSWLALARLCRGEGERAWQLLDMLDPLTHSEDESGARRYVLEPYVIAADVYTAPGHEGRGGWSWYTGSAAWYYRIAMEHMLGLTLRDRGGDSILSVDPCIPGSWGGFRATVRHGDSTYRVVVSDELGAGRGVRRTLVDGMELDSPVVRLEDDGSEHLIEIMLGD